MNNWLLIKIVNIRNNRYKRRLKKKKILDAVGFWTRDTLVTSSDADH